MLKFNILSFVLQSFKNNFLMRTKGSITNCCMDLAKRTKSYMKISNMKSIQNNPRAKFLETVENKFY